MSVAKPSDITMHSLYASERMEGIYNPHPLVGYIIPLFKRGGTLLLIWYSHLDNPQE